MHLLFKCIAPEFVDDPTHAIVEMTSGLAKYILALMERAKKLKAEDSGFEGLLYYEYSPEFMDLGLEDRAAVCKMLSTPEKEYDFEDFDDDQDWGWLSLPQKFELSNPTSMRPCSLHVDENCFYWEATHKHGGMGSQVETHSCTEKELREFLKEMQNEVLG